MSEKKFKSDRQSLLYLNIVEETDRINLNGLIRATVKTADEEEVLTIADTVREELFLRFSKTGEDYLKFEKYSFRYCHALIRRIKTAETISGKKDALGRPFVECAENLAILEQNIPFGFAGLDSVSSTGRWSSCGLKKMFEAFGNPNVEADELKKSVFDILVGLCKSNKIIRQYFSAVVCECEKHECFAAEIRDFLAKLYKNGFATDSSRVFLEMMYSQNAQTGFMLKA